MARVIGGISTSHIPSIGKAIENNLQETEYWQPFFKNFPGIHAWLEQEKPDVAVVFYLSLIHI